MSAASRSVLALPIFPGRLQPSIFGAGELNCRVRDGNGWTLTAINTNYFNWLAPIKINYFIIQRSHYAVKGESLGKNGDPCGNRTHVCGVRGRRLSRLTNGPCHASRLSLRHAAHHSAKTPLRCAQTAFCLRGSLCACFQAFSASFWCAFTDSNRGPTD